MPLPVADVENILYNKGFLKFSKTPAQINPDSGGPLDADIQNRVDMYFFMARSEVNRADNTITLRATDARDPYADTVNAVYQDNFASVGRLLPPGYVYTGNLSGCVFYLYRGLVGFVFGVHASRASGILADPSQYFIRRGASLLYKWDSLGKLTGPLQGSFGAVLCCVDQADIEAFAVAYNPQTGQVRQVFDHKTIQDWRRAISPSL